MSADPRVELRTAATRELADIAYAIETEATFAARHDQMYRLYHLASRVRDVIDAVLASQQQERN